jgi:type I restriction enzyme S subunit
MVEWKKLGEVFEIRNGYTPSKNNPDYWENGTIPWFRMEDIRLNGGILSDSIQHITPASIKTSGLFPANTIIVATTATIGEHALVIVDSLANQRFTALISRKSLTQSVLPRFAYYYCFKLDDWCKNHIRQGGFASVDMDGFKKYPFPIPSLSEQNRIVGILDTFTASIDNLKEQIAQRRKQYEYYRDELLDLEGKEGVEMKTLGEIGEFIRGAGILKSDFVDEGFPCIHYGQIHTRYGISATKAISHIDESLYKKSKKAVKGDVILATTSEDAEGCAKPVAWLGEEKVAVSCDAYIYHHNQNGKFMAYQFMTHNFMLFKIMNATGAKVVRISGDNMAKYEFPLPPLSEQQRIVSILDTFKASIQNLEAQLKERQKQYEYYRNKLLTFE